MYEEAPGELGVCHFLEAAAFTSTGQRSAADVQAFAQASGITSQAVFNREVVMFKVDSLRSAAPSALGMLADAALRPAFSEADVAAARVAIRAQRDDALSQPQLLVSEHLYAAAYGRDTPLGRLEKCPDDRVAAVTGRDMRAFMDRHFAPHRMVLSAVGIDHAAAVEAAAALFGPSAFVASPRALPPQSPRPGARFLGGDVRSSPDWAAQPASATASTAKREFTHLMIGFPTVGWAHDDVVPLCVVDTLLGGGSSFSAGGPGKGMYSRLYLEVLNRHGWVEAANAFSAQLYDSGVFGIYGAAPADHAGALLETLSRQLVTLLSRPVTPVELARARNQLASSVSMNLETRALLCEDIGRQVLNHGKRLDPSELLRRIQAVSAADIQRVMREALSHAPALAVVGEHGAVPEYRALQAFFDHHVRLSSKEGGGSVKGARGGRLH